MATKLQMIQLWIKKTFIEVEVALEEPEVIEEVTQEEITEAESLE